MTPLQELALRQAAADAIDADPDAARMIRGARRPRYQAGQVLTHPAGFTATRQSHPITGRLSFLVACVAEDCEAAWETRDNEAYAMATGERHAHSCH